MQVFAGNLLDDVPIRDLEVAPLKTAVIFRVEKFGEAVVVGFQAFTRASFPETAGKFVFLPQPVGFVLPNVLAWVVGGELTGEQAGLDYASVFGMDHGGFC